MNRDLSIQKLAKKCVISHCNTLEKSNYKSSIKSLGSMIIQNGLYGTVVFYRAKKDNHYKYILEDMSKFFEKFYDYKDKKDNFLSLLEFLEKEKLNEYQDRMLEFTNWYRRYADIFIEKDEKTEEKNRG
ncbi:MAG: CRISPR-associated protein Cmr5 [Oceanotoga sp.]|uniref:type III-B CRISPR module-associated protein Cmr5 n=1 Tax=Oceanotoga sp. TaxID=2108366 RepID=UPI00264EF1F3|nr:type III-B CRISPR module-associated protein Cmr5 [Oceanotoga sp.]MDN5342616.1 CRISPR-associated protein Cmr5 [Oceanotoga sp.]